MKTSQHRLTDIIMETFVEAHSVGNQLLRPRGVTAETITSVFTMMGINYSILQKRPIAECFPKKKHSKITAGLLDTSVVIEATADIACNMHGSQHDLDPAPIAVLFPHFIRSLNLVTRFVESEFERKRANESTVGAIVTLPSGEAALTLPDNISMNLRFVALAPQITGLLTLGELEKEDLAESDSLTRSLTTAAASFYTSLSSSEPTHHRVMLAFETFLDTMASAERELMEATRRN